MQKLSSQGRSWCAGLAGPVRCVSLFNSFLQKALGRNDGEERSGRVYPLGWEVKCVLRTSETGRVVAGASLMCLQVLNKPRINPRPDPARRRGRGREGNSQVDRTGEKQGGK